MDGNVTKTAVNAAQTPQPSQPAQATTSAQAAKVPLDGRMLAPPEQISMFQEVILPALMGANPGALYYGRVTRQHNEAYRMYLKGAEENMEIIGQAARTAAERGNVAALSGLKKNVEGMFGKSAYEALINRAQEVRTSFPFIAKNMLESETMRDVLQAVVPKQKVPGTNVQTNVPAVTPSGQPATKPLSIEPAEIQQAPEMPTPETNNLPPVQQAPVPRVADAMAAFKKQISISYDGSGNATVKFDPAARETMDEKAARHFDEALTPEEQDLMLDNMLAKKSVDVAETKDPETGRTTRTGYDPATGKILWKTEIGKNGKSRTERVNEAGEVVLSEKRAAEQAAAESFEDRVTRKVREERRLNNAKNEAYREYQHRLEKQPWPFAPIDRETFNTMQKNVEDYAKAYEPGTNFFGQIQNLNPSTKQVKAQNWLSMRMSSELRGIYNPYYLRALTRKIFSALDLPADAQRQVESAYLDQLEQQVAGAQPGQPAPDAYFAWPEGLDMAAMLAPQNQNPLP